MAKEIIKAFVSLGLSDKEAKVLALIVVRKTVMARELERILDMRQPDVSLTLTNLQSRGWIRTGDKVKSRTMARVSNTYGLAMSIGMIVEGLEKQKQTNEAEMNTALKVLRGLNV